MDSRHSDDAAVGSLSSPRATSLSSVATPAAASETPVLQVAGETSTPVPEVATPSPSPSSATTLAPTALPVPLPQATNAQSQPTPIPVPPPSPGSINHGLADLLVQMINNERAKVGVSHVTQNAALTAAAQDYSELHFLSADPFQLNHYLDGGPGDRATRNGYLGRAAEALVTGAPQAEQLMQAWLNSPPHRDILLDSQYRDIGVGCYEGSYTDASGSTFRLALCVATLGRP